jgi:hypothetical protein
VFTCADRVGADRVASYTSIPILFSWFIDVYAFVR